MHLISLPMYDIDSATTAATTSALLKLLAKRDVTAEVVAPDDLLTHWRDDNLLLSQTCGYALVSQLPEVQLVGTMQSCAAGCQDLRYRSWLVVRQAENARMLEDFRGRRAVCNSADSHSGYNALRYAIAPLAENGKFFAETHFSGSHQQSLAALRRNEADIAAIDCITWALLQKYQPQALADVTIIGETPLCPALPLITSARTDSLLLEKLRSALFELANVEDFKPLMQANLLAGFSVPRRSYYDEVLAWEQQAAAMGVTRL
ncbi:MULTISPECIES: phosphate/phosphite/phosphonate ABC transporter substrate-binding protein [Pantoea]|uniref:phosphate/phosphite/phosphonate ABC transporter substrate-binding protein n=1 Tax=Pantoea TaxID=53335 RepID=UPI000DE31A1B|nr:MULTISPECIES: PhnD/SsuA/transferrin family substrate-binding protein [Pantoea]RBO14101.1 phosphate ABC transporter substrate-binding protein [Pantoea sp. 3_1284]